MREGGGRRLCWHRNIFSFLPLPSQLQCSSSATTTTLRQKMCEGGGGRKEVGVKICKMRRRVLYKNVLFFCSFAKRQRNWLLVSVREGEWHISFSRNWRVKHTLSQLQLLTSTKWHPFPIFPPPPPQILGRGDELKLNEFLSSSSSSSSFHQNPTGSKKNIVNDKNLQDFFYFI